MKLRVPAWLILVAVFGMCPAAHSQGTFVNLNFEQPVLPLVRDAFFMVPTTNAIPGWTAYVGGVQQGSIIYNTRPLDAAEVTLQGPGSDSLTPIQGSYTVEFFGASPFAPQLSSAVGQIGEIPANVQSLEFHASSLALQVSFAGHSIPLVQVGSGTGYVIVGGDISPFAGQLGELLFTAPAQTASVLDYIQFSSLPVPEPSIFSLAGIGAVLLGLRFLRRT
jgi:hypothetical protein